MDAQPANFAKGAKDSVGLEVPSASIPESSEMMDGSHMMEGDNEDDDDDYFLDEENITVPK